MNIIRIFYLKFTFFGGIFELAGFRNVGSDLILFAISPADFRHSNKQ